MQPFTTVHDVLGTLDELAAIHAEGDQLHAAAAEAAAAGPSVAEAEGWEDEPREH